MAAIDSNPITTKLQAEQWFKFELKRAPSLSYFCQGVKLPKISADSADQFTPFLTLPKTPDHLTFDPLTINFQVDANLENWLEIFNWMTAITGLTPSNLSKPTQFSPYTYYSDIMLYILDSQRLPKYTIIFENAFPILLDSLDFSSTVSTTKFMIASTTFKYTKYHFVNA
jgi:hypothetical protein